MRTVAVLPVKTFARAKQRLAESVGADERRALAEAMVRDVLEALAGVAALDGTIVVTAEPVAVQAAHEAGAHVVHDPREAGQSAAAVRGVDAALERGAERVLLVPGDCPALDPAEIAAWIDGRPPGGGGPQVVIVPDRHGHGTNALLLTPPTAMAPSFGPGSLARHAARARAGGAAVKVAPVRSLELDVDTPGDLAALRQALAARPGVAPRTRELLERVLPAASPAG